MNVTTNKLHQSNDAIFVGNSQFIKDLTKKVLQVAAFDCTVLILGESGTGKEVIADSIHKYSNKSGPMIKVNCGAIPENLLESELFGYTEGAFTGAKTGGKPGKFEEAHNGTLFLDEIGDLPLHLQVKLLRVLQGKEIVRVGSSKIKQINTRVIAATNKDLRTMVEEGKFREDLYYRLNVVPIYNLPLRERREDIIPLILHFKKKYQKKYETKRHCSAEVLKQFESYDWPGNVREIENFIERLIVIMDPSYTITAEAVLKDYLETNRQHGKKDITVHQFMTLKEANEKVESQLIKMAASRYRTLKEIADALGVDQSTICRKLKQLNIQRF